MHIGFVSQYVYPHDEEVRITKCARSLVNAGHRVTVFCRAEATSGHLETSAGVTVRRFSLPRSLKWLQGTVTSTLPMNPAWIAWLWSSIHRAGVHLCVVRNLRLAPATILAARIARVPVVMDLGENHPAMARALGIQKVGHYLTRNRLLIATLERWCIRRVAEVWVVAESNRRRLQRELRGVVGGGQVRLIRNVPEVDEQVAEIVAPRVAQGVRDRVLLAYLGILDNLRGLEMVLQALAGIPSSEGRIELAVIGDGPERQRLMALVSSLHLEQRVRFHGWVSGPERFSRLVSADIGLLPHRVSYFTQTTLPNKLFDYMLAGLPVIATPLDPVREILEEVGCGLTAEASASAFATAILQLVRDPARRRLMGERGRRAVVERYNWGVESRAVLAAVGGLVRSGTSNGSLGLASST